MDTARPAAGPLLSLQQFLDGPRNPAQACRRLLRILNPADELIPAEGRQIFPQCKRLRVRLNRCSKVVGCFVDRTVGKGFFHWTFRRCGIAAPATFAEAPVDRNNGKPAAYNLAPNADLASKGVGGGACTIMCPARLSRTSERWKSVGFSADVERVKGICSTSRRR